MPCTHICIFHYHPRLNSVRKFSVVFFLCNLAQIHEQKMCSNWNDCYWFKSQKFERFQCSWIFYHQTHQHICIRFYHSTFIDRIARKHQNTSLTLNTMYFLDSVLFLFFVTFIPHDFFPRNCKKMPGRGLCFHISFKHNVRVLIMNKRKWSDVISVILD